MASVLSKWILLGCVLMFANAAHAEALSLAEPSASTQVAIPSRTTKRTLSLEVASGVVVLGEGMTSLEAGLSLIDLGIAWVPVRYFIGRVALGYAPMVDRHSVNNFARVRIEGGLHLEIMRLVTILGAGAALWNQSPSVHGLFGLAVRFASTWQLGVDIRSGPFWDLQDLPRRHKLTPYGEGQIRMSWAFR